MLGLGLTDRSQPIRSSACSADAADVELVSQQIVYDNSLDHQHSSIQKLAKRWFGPYEVRKVFDNRTYRLYELDGIVLRVPIVEKRVKIFKKRSDAKPYVTLDNLNT